jgi:hypothetical protein
MVKFKEENKEIKQYKDFPYCLVGSSCIPDSFHITLEGKGIKAIAKLLKDEDLLHITLFAGSKATKWEISESIKEKKR